MIWDRFLASQMSSAQIESNIADFENNGYIFRSTGNIVTFPGYLSIYEETNDDVSDDQYNVGNSKIPVLEVGERLIKKSVDATQHFTEPPLRFDEASLIKFLEEKGIGRPSTYSPIITVILARGYVVREGRFLVPTQLGEIITKVMDEHFSDILDYQFTADMEASLDTIEHGNIKMEDVLSEFYAKFEHELKVAGERLEKGDISLPVEETDIICELCGSKMIIKNGRFGKFAACPNYPKCKNTKPLNKSTNEVLPDPKIDEETKCDICGAPMVIKQGKFGSFYACSNYPNCKGTKAISTKTDVSCPICGSEVVSKFTKSKKQFYSCSKYPQCKFSTWDEPTNKKCPECSGILLKKKMKGYLYCSNEECKYKENE